jgi:hypothetical protein
VEGREGSSSGSTGRCWENGWLHLNIRNY